jgi:hypothetical protein
MYAYEYELTNDFVSSLEDNENLWGDLAVKTEFFYQRGRTDVVAITTNSEVIAFEVKLKRWKDALHQAYRNRCFAHLSYIVVPEKVAQRLLQFSSEFEQRNVGVCYMEDNEIKVNIPATRAVPLQKWLSERAISEVTGVEKVATFD